MYCLIVSQTLFSHFQATRHDTQGHVTSSLLVKKMECLDRRDKIISTSNQQENVLKHLKFCSQTRNAWFSILLKVSQILQALRLHIQNTRKLQFYFVKHFQTVKHLFYLRKHCDGNVANDTWRWLWWYFPISGCRWTARARRITSDVPHTWIAKGL